ncbi:MAG: hypothetical protein JSR28_04255 [Proteobacteria bacterium]|nr:hypothetical protein [Pseudomonadota bacterium]
MRRRRFLGATIAAALTQRAGAQISEPPLRCVGYNDMGEMLTDLAAHYAIRVPGARFVFDLKSTRSAPVALLEGRADLAPMGAEMERGDLAAITARWGKPPLALAIAHASLSPTALSSPTGVYVATGNPLVRIDLAALARILGASEPQSWRDAGIARPGRIRLFGLGEETAIGKFVMRQIGIDRFAPHLQRFGQSRDVVTAMAGDRDAFGFANLNHARPELRILALGARQGDYVVPTARTIISGCYPFDRRLLVYLPLSRNGRPDAATSHFMRFALSDEGQAVISRGSRGYLPLSRSERVAEIKKL